MNVAVPQSGGFGAVGRQASRVDGPLKVAGRARFAAEVPFEGLTYAALVFSGVARGRIASIGAAAAEAAPGVLLVMTHKTAPRMASPPLIVAATYPYYRMPGWAARIRLTADGRAVVSTAAHEMGMGAATVQAQFAADRLGLSPEQIVFEYGDTALPNGGMGGGSSQSASIAAAVIAASDALVDELLRLAGDDSPLTGLAPADVEARHAGLYRRDDSERSETYASILARSGRDEVLGEADAPIMNHSLAEYHVPTHLDVPEIEVLWTDIPDPQAPLGLRGVGEIGITGCGAAVANAVYNATGIRVRDLPITLDKLISIQE